RRAARACVRLRRRPPPPRRPPPRRRFKRGGTMSAPVRVALPRGDLRGPLAERLAAAGLAVPGYGEGARTYRSEVGDPDGVVVRVFSDADIPIQVALGQYDLGVASRTCVDELLVRYRHESIVPLLPLDLAGEPLVLAGAPDASLEALACNGAVRVATEYPNI